MATETRHTATMEEFAETFGYFPATVSGHKQFRDGIKLETIDNDPDSDIIVFADDTPPTRTEEFDGRV